MKKKIKINKEKEKMLNCLYEIICLRWWCKAMPPFKQVNEHTIKLMTKKEAKESLDKRIKEICNKYGFKNDPKKR